MYCGSVMIPKSCLPGVQVSYDTVFVVSQCPITGSVSNFSQFTIAAIFLIWAHTLCKHVTCIHSPGTGKLLKQDHYQGRDLPQGVEGVEWPIIPRSHPVVQYLCHRLQHHHVCTTYICVSLKQDHYQGRDLPQGVEGVEWPIIPRSHPVVQYLCHRLQHHHVCACVYYIHMCQYECVHAVCPPPRHSLTEHVHT